MNRTIITRFVITKDAKSPGSFHQAFGVCDGIEFEARYVHLLNQFAGWRTDTPGLSNVQKRMIGRAATQAEKNKETLIERRTK